MSKHHKDKDLPYLNRLALLHEADPFELNPMTLLRKLIEPNDRFPFQQNMRKISISALGEKYKISENSPENAVFCLKKIEIMLEIAYLVLFQANGEQATGATIQASRRSSKTPVRYRVLRAIVLRR